MVIRRPRQNTHNVFWKLRVRQIAGSFIQSATELHVNIFLTVRIFYIPSTNFTEHITQNLSTIHKRFLLAKIFSLCFFFLLFGVWESGDLPRFLSGKSVWQLPQATWIVDVLNKLLKLVDDISENLSVGSFFEAPFRHSFIYLFFPFFSACSSWQTT